MDIALLERLGAPTWAGERFDLACGTGRTDATAGVRNVDGVDLTPETLRQACQRGAHDHLGGADISDTGLPDDTYDLDVASLADEHLDELGTLYRETARIASAATFVLVSFIRTSSCSPACPRTTSPPTANPWPSRRTCT